MIRVKGGMGRVVSDGIRKVIEGYIRQGFVGYCKYFDFYLD